MKSVEDKEELLSFGDHLEVLRKSLFRIIGVVIFFTIGVFYFKDQTFRILLGPSESSFILYRWVDTIMSIFKSGFVLEPFHVNLIATDLSSQFLTHLSTAIYLGILIATPYILVELFKFVSPALYNKENASFKKLLCVAYILFISGILMSYFILFPVAFRFLGTYSVDARVVSNITLDSYISSFIVLTLMLGLVFQMPVIMYVLAKKGMINSDMLAHYRKQAIICILILAAVITPPDIMTLILVGLPLYLLYEISIRIVKRYENKDSVSSGYE